MAVINKIRKRSGLLIIVIGLAMGAFILGDFLRNQRGSANRPTNSIGEIYGEKINRDRFESQVEQMVQNRKQRTGEEVSAAQRKRIEDQVWNQLVRERIYMRQVKDLGIEVPPAEFKDLIAGENVHPQIRRMFSSQQGGFNKQMVLRRVQQGFKNSPEFKRQWLRIESEIKKDRRFTKFHNLVKKAMYVNNTEARDAYNAENRTADIDFIVKKYRDIPDTAISYSEDDIESFYQKHKDDPQYEQESSRSFEYVVFDAGPSPSDIQVVKKKIMELKDRFLKAENDSVFAMNHSDPIERYIRYIRKGELEPAFDTVLFASDTGDVVGPFKQDNKFIMHKVMNIEKKADSVKARHILLQKPRGQKDKTDSLRNVLDSIRTVIQENDNFAPMARRVSQDKGTSSKGGSLGWFGPGKMVPAFDSTCFNGEVGDLSIVETRFGVHLIEIMDKTEPVQQYQVATVEHSIDPSSETLDSVYNEARKLVVKVDQGTPFNKAVQKGGYQKRLASRVKESDQSVARLPSSRKLVRWAFESKKDDVTLEPKRCGNNFVVAQLTEVRKEGSPKLENIREDIVARVIKKKKADLIRKQMDGAEDLGSVSAKLNEEVRSATGITFNSTSLPGGGGNELKVIGKLMQLEEGYISKPLEGKIGVYLVAMKNLEEAPEPNATQLAAKKQRLQRRRVSSVNYQLFMALKEEAKVEDERNTLP